MPLARFVLIFTGISFFGYAVACFVDPVGVAGRFTGYGLEAAAGLVEVRAMYGGLQAGFGVFCLLAGWRREWTVPGLTAIATVMGGLVLTRSIAMGIHGPAGFNPHAAIYEGITTALAVLALFRLRERV
ncbi:MAG: DUF4345 family protein [Gammaproteobacteria bacterium]